MTHVLKKQCGLGERGLTRLHGASQRFQKLQVLKNQCEEKVHTVESDFNLVRWIERKLNSIISSSKPCIDHYEIKEKKKVGASLKVSLSGRKTLNLAVNILVSVCGFLSLFIFSSFIAATRSLEFVCPEGPCPRIRLIGF